FFFSSRRRHTRFSRDWSSDVCSSDLEVLLVERLGGGDIDGDLHQPPDLLEIAERGLGLRQHVDGAQLRGFLTGSHIDILAEQAEIGRASWWERAYYCAVAEWLRRHQQ